MKQQSEKQQTYQKKPESIQQNAVQQQQVANPTSNSTYFKSFTQHLTKKFSLLSHSQLLSTLIQSQISNKKLRTHLSIIQPFKQRNLRPPNLNKTNQLFQEFQTAKFALKICYLGHLYDGMALQFQTDNTVEEFFFKALRSLNLIKDKQPQEYTRAGRTDKGVSAMGNVVALKMRTKKKKSKQAIKQPNQQQPLTTDKNKTTSSQQLPAQTLQSTYHLPYCQMLNSILPDDIRILACQQVPLQFNARYCCKQRSYKYFFVKNCLNIQIMQQAIKSFVGRHNFINYCKMNLSNTVNFQREIVRAEIVKVEHQEHTIPFNDKRNQVYYFHFVGNSFLWHQIRFMSSVLFMVGQGSQPANIVKDLLSIQKYPCKPNYSMAPQYPLILQDCLYDSLTFNPMAQTIYRFQNTFHSILSGLTIQATLITNCMHLARRDLLANISISTSAFQQNVIQNYKRTHKSHKKSMQLHKASGRGMDEAIKSLRGKKKQLFEKKQHKQRQFEQKSKIKIQTCPKQQQKLQHSQQSNQNHQQHQKQ